MDHHQDDEQARWLEWRRGGVGASDSPAILGVCPHRTRMAVYLDKVGAAKPRKQTETQEWGIRLEPLITAAYAERADLAIVNRQACLESTEQPWLRATIDGIAEDGRIVEFKALGLHAANEFRAPVGGW
ncbi:lambda-exonuclease family protein [Paludisphaera soli]|uniref:lambda-exonuclease family protein n=1 Tax=Paludisphaera soli TaxID=2712865 RepID=UPI0013EC2F30|nr:YqaJ viral recombinase family protein [Paludisphaera soli]